FSSRRRHTRFSRDWSSDVCSSDLAGVAASFTVNAFMPNPVALGLALVIGGAVIAPALTLENSLVGRIAPASMLNEAYTWVVTVKVGRASCRETGAAGGGEVCGE